MTHTIRRRGFGVIELMIALVVVLLLGWKLLDHLGVQRATTGKAADILRQSLRRDLQELGPVRFRFATPSTLDGTNSKGSFRYMVTGEKPNGRIDREDVGGTKTLFERCVFAEFQAYDSEGALLFDRGAGADPARIDTIKFEMRFHEEKERADLYVNDGFHGVDIDGDPTNGVARVFSDSIAFKPLR